MKFSANGIRILKEVFHKAVKEGSLRGKPVEKAYMTDLLQAIIDQGFRIDSVPVHGGWVEVDTVADLESMTLRSRLSEMGFEK
jgi:NDP-sugar pyrophosphorylase family protein